MFCVNNEGCPKTEIQISVYVNNGEEIVKSGLGSITVINHEGIKSPTPTLTRTQQPTKDKEGDNGGR